MQIVLTAATPFEIAPTLQWIEKTFTRRESGAFELGPTSVFPLITGVGMTATAWALAQFLARNQPDLMLNAGIAGALDRSFQLGDVFNIESERFADLGVEQADGRFTDLFELGLTTPGDAPFTDALLRNPAAGQSAFLPSARGITVNKVHGSQASILAVREKYPDAQVESMEGAAFFYACISAGMPFLEIRSISNYVEPRNRDAWDLPLAINNLNKTLKDLLESC